MENLTEQEILEYLYYLTACRNVQVYGTERHKQAQARLDNWILEIQKWEDENGIIIY